MLVHGEKGKMKYLSEKIKQELGLDCYKPANGETVVIPTEMDLHVDCKTSLIDELEKNYGPLSLTKSKGEEITHRRRIISKNNHKNKEMIALKRQRINDLALVIINNEDMCVMSDKQACEEFNLARHMIKFEAKWKLCELPVAVMLKALETTLENNSVVDWETHLGSFEYGVNEMIKEGKKEKGWVEMYRSLHVREVEEDWVFQWIYTDDSFSDDYFEAIEDALKETI